MIRYMARSLSQATRLGVLVAGASSPIPLHRRGYAAAYDVSVRAGSGRSGCMSGMVGSTEEKTLTRDWAPDPVTGYYRPVNHTPEIDPVELRQILLNNKLRSSH